VSKSGGDHFVGDGFREWKNARRLTNQPTSSNNSHVDCVHMVDYALVNPNQSIKEAFVNQNKQQMSNIKSLWTHPF